MQLTRQCMEALLENFTKSLREDVAYDVPWAARKSYLTWQPGMSTPFDYFFSERNAKWRLSNRPARRLRSVCSQTGVRSETRYCWRHASFEAARLLFSTGVAEGFAPIDVDLPLWNLSMATLLVP